MSRRVSVAERIRTGLILLVALGGFVFSFALSQVSRGPNSEANSMRKRILADAGVREEELRPGAADEPEEDAQP